MERGRWGYYELYQKLESQEGSRVLIWNWEEYPCLNGSTLVILKHVECGIIVVFVCCLLSKNLLNKLDIWSDRKSHLKDKNLCRKYMSPKMNILIPHKMGREDESVQNSSRSRRSLVSSFPPHLLKWSDREVTSLVVCGLVGIVTGLACTQRFPWLRNPFLMSSLGKTCQNPYIQSFIDFSVKCSVPDPHLANSGTCDSHLNSATVRSALRTWLPDYPHEALKKMLS